MGISNQKKWFLMGRKRVIKMSRKKLISLIKMLAIVANEIVIDFSIGDFDFNSIEWDKKNNKILLHKFEDDDIDIEFDYDDLPESWKKELYFFLIRNFLN